MDDLIVFVRARLDEDEAAAKTAASVAGPDWRHKLFLDLDGGATTMIVSAAGSPLADTLHRDDEEMAPFIARHDPARELRQVMATRAVLTAYEMSVRMLGEGLSRDKLMLVRAHAVIWEDHPDYRPEWRP